MTMRALVFTLGPYRLLVEAVRVCEVLEHGGVSRVRGGGHVSWRGRLVPEISLSALLDCPEQDCEGLVDIVYGNPEGAAVLFKVDRVLGLRGLNRDQQYRLPALAPALLRLFSVIVLDPVDRRGILWMEAGPELLLEQWHDYCEARCKAVPEPSGPGWLS